MLRVKSTEVKQLYCKSKDKVIFSMNYFQTLLKVWKRYWLTESYGLKMFFPRKEKQFGRTYSFVILEFLDGTSDEQTDAAGCFLSTNWKQYGVNRWVDITQYSCLMSFKVVEIRAIDVVSYAKTNLVTSCVRSWNVSRIFRVNLSTRN